MPLRRHSQSDLRYQREKALARAPHPTRPTTPLIRAIAGRSRGEVFGTWKVRVSTRRLNGSVFVRVRRSAAKISVERGSSRPRDVRLAPQRAGRHRRRENRSASSRGPTERQSHGARTNPSSCPAQQNRLPTAEAGRVIVFGERTFRFRRLQIFGSWHRASVFLRRLALGIA